MEDKYQQLLQIQEQKSLGEIKEAEENKEDLEDLQYLFQQQARTESLISEVVDRSLEAIIEKPGRLSIDYKLIEHAQHKENAVKMTIIDRISKANVEDALGLTFIDKWQEEGLEKLIDKYGVDKDTIDSITELKPEIVRKTYAKRALNKSENEKKENG